VWKLFPRGQVINLSFWDYNDVAPGYFAAAEIAARDPHVGLSRWKWRDPIARSPTAATSPTPICALAAKGLYVIPRLLPGQAASRIRDRSGFEFHRESRETAAETRSGRINVKVIAAVSEELIRSPAAGVSRFRTAGPRLATT